MSLIRHPPWVGDVFRSTIVPRVMILGESHHNDEDPTAVDMTGVVIEEWLSGISNPAYRFYTHLAVALSGEEPWKLNRHDVFRRIMFYNYVQAVMRGSREAPTTQDFAEAETPFREVIEEHRPTHIIACGGRLWENMPPFDAPDAKGKDIRLADKEFLVGRYRTQNAAPLAMCIRHPQSGFNGREWYPCLQAFMELR